jgi:hypothetical protein
MEENITSTGKTVFLGDIHGRTIWEDILKEEQDAARIVFVGDYFDSFNIGGVAQLYNFLKIVEYKKNSDKEVVLLFGNHDYHYMPGFIGSGYSGYQAGLAYQFREAISNNLEHFKMCYLFDDILCSHAGISYIWLQDTFGLEKDEDWFMENISDTVDMINEYFKYRPTIFDFNGINSYGDDVWQTPIWIRPASLMKANKETLKKKVIQIVGHTGVEDIFKSVLMTKKSMGGRYYLVDALDSGGYLTYENNTFTPKQINLPKD